MIFNYETSLIANDLELQLNKGNISIDDIQNALDEFDDSIPFDVKGDDLSIQQLDDFFGITNEERKGEGSATGDTQEELTGYTEAELATREREQKQREKQAAADELKAKQKEEADKSIDGFADEMLGNYGTQDLFGGNPLANLGRADKIQPTDPVEDEFEKRTGNNTSTDTIDITGKDDTARSSSSLDKSIAQSPENAIAEKLPTKGKVVAKNHNAIYQGKGDSYILAKLNGKAKIAFVQVKKGEDGSFYEIKNATPGRDDQFKNKKPVWERNGPIASSDEQTSLIPGAKSSGESIAQSPENAIPTNLPRK